MVAAAGQTPQGMDPPMTRSAQGPLSASLESKVGSQFNICQPPIVRLETRGKNPGVRPESVYLVNSFR